MTMRELKQVSSNNEYLTVEEAAVLLGVKEMSIRNYLSDGKFTTFKFKTLTLLKKDEVERWKDRQRSH